MNPVEVIEKQLVAYNAHDLKGFVETYSPNIRIFRFPGNELVLEGLPALRERYGKRLATPGLKVEIASRTVRGNFVIDLEHVTSEEQEGVKEVVAIYEVHEDLIQNVWFLWG